jgi:hypothetical protein
LSAYDSIDAGIKNTVAETPWVICGKTRINKGWNGEGVSDGTPSRVFCWLSACYSQSTGHAEKQCLLICLNRLEKNLTLALEGQRHPNAREVLGLVRLYAFRLTVEVQHPDAYARAKEIMTRYLNDEPVKGVALRSLGARLVEYSGTLSQHALTCAAANGRADLVNWLIEHQGLPVDTTDATIAAAENGHRGVAWLLWRNAIRRDEELLSTLHRSIAQRDAVRVAKLLKSVDFDSEDLYEALTLSASRDVSGVIADALNGKLTEESKKELLVKAWESRQDQVFLALFKGVRNNLTQEERLPYLRRAFSEGRSDELISALLNKSVSTLLGNGARDLVHAGSGADRLKLMANLGSLGKLPNATIKELFNELFSEQGECRLNYLDLHDLAMTGHDRQKIAETPPAIDQIKTDLLELVTDTAASADDASNLFAALFCGDDTPEHEVVLQHVLFALRIKAKFSAKADRSSVSAADQSLMIKLAACLPQKTLARYLDSELDREKPRPAVLLSIFPHLKFDSLTRALEHKLLKKAGMEVLSDPDAQFGLEAAFRISLGFADATPLLEKMAGQMTSATASRVGRALHTQFNTRADAGDEKKWRAAKATLTVAFIRNNPDKRVTRFMLANLPFNVDKLNPFDLVQEWARSESKKDNEEIEFETAEESLPRGAMGVRPEPSGAGAVDSVPVRVMHGDRPGSDDERQVIFTNRMVDSFLDVARGERYASSSALLGALLQLANASNHVAITNWWNGTFGREVRQLAIAHVRKDVMDAWPQIKRLFGE